MKEINRRTALTWAFLAVAGPVNSGTPDMATGGQGQLRLSLSSLLLPRNGKAFVYTDASNGEIIGALSATDTLGAPVTGVTYAIAAGSAKFAIAADMLQRNAIGSIGVTTPELVKISASKTGYATSERWFAIFPLSSIHRPIHALSSNIVNIVWNGPGDPRITPVMDGLAGSWKITTVSSPHSALNNRTYAHLGEATMAALTVNATCRLKIQSGKYQLDLNWGYYGGAFPITATTGVTATRDWSVEPSDPAIPVQLNAKDGPYVILDTPFDTRADHQIIFDRIDMGPFDTMEPAIGVSDRWRNRGNVLTVGSKLNARSIEAGTLVEVYTAGNAAVMPPPLVDHNLYYWIKDSFNTGRLATSKANALAGVAITLSGGDMSAAPGVLSGWGVIEERATYTVNTLTGECTLGDSYFNTFEKFTRVILSNKGGAGPTGFTTTNDIFLGTQYWVVPTGTGKFKLATTAQNARDGVFVIPSTAGTGTQIVTPLQLQGGGDCYAFRRCHKVYRRDCRISRHYGNGTVTFTEYPVGMSKYVQCFDAGLEIATNGADAFHHNYYTHKIGAFNLAYCHSHSSMGDGFKTDSANRATLLSCTIDGHRNGHWLNGSNNVLWNNDYSDSHARQVALRTTPGGFGAAISNNIRPEADAGWHRGTPPYFEIPGARNSAPNEPLTPVYQGPSWKYQVASGPGLSDAASMIALVYPAYGGAGVLQLEGVAIFNFKQQDVGVGASLNIRIRRNDGTWYEGTCVSTASSGGNLTIGSFSPPLTGTISAGCRVNLKRTTRNWDLPRLNEAWHGNPLFWDTIAPKAAGVRKLDFSASYGATYRIPTMRIEDVFVTNMLSSLPSSQPSIVSTSKEITVQQGYSSNNLGVLYTGLPLAPQKNLAAVTNWANNNPPGAGEYRFDAGPYSSPPFGTHGTGGGGVNDSWCVHYHPVVINNLSYNDVYWPMADSPVGSGWAWATPQSGLGSPGEANIHIVQSNGSLVGAPDSSNPLPTQKRFYLAAASLGDAHVTVRNATAAPVNGDRAHLTIDDDSAPVPGYFHICTIGNVASLGGGSYSFDIDNPLPGNVTADNPGVSFVPAGAHGIPGWDPESWKDVGDQVGISA